MEFPAVDEVENLHHDECIEDKSKVPRIDAEFFIDGIVIFIPVDVVESARSYGASYYSIAILVFGVIFEECLVVGSRVLGHKLVG